MFPVIFVTIYFDSKLQFFAALIEQENEKVFTSFHHFQRSAKLIIPSKKNLLFVQPRTSKNTFADNPLIDFLGMFLDFSCAAAVTRKW